MNILIRVDASSLIGAGHVMRCLTLADALYGKADCHFMCAAENGHLQRLIQQRGYQVLEVAPFTNELEHASQCLAQLTRDYDLLIVDHYQLSSVYEGMMRAICRKVMVVDDLANRQHDCDILLDQNLLADINTRYQGLVPEACELLLGPDYCLLRPEFTCAQKANIHKNNSLMVSLGGSDPNNHSRKVLAAIEQLGWQEPVDIVLGGGSPWNQQLKQEFAHLSQVNWHIQCDYMAQLMSEARLAIGTGGSSHWERCMVGLPAIVITVADNQVPTTELLAQQDICYNLGKANDVTVSKLAHTLLCLWGDEHKLMHMAESASQLIATDGCAKVVQRILVI
ncbi:UDP-2,4-diacetamido-2,4,6-trideoxy-beta-L-altropyranose hydrolase [Shewanella sairae]|uniref:UDP-2,4-diacetamido-2,4, 6-trideoxy-beta-L-altropyranose hydrolase n=1 Tax=Shewanella sairae TaxID=190310 RepID=A0ABQ4PRL6_9GAMM|nr:UDP-2,4-diacetamido-2,4,6-trideoxy-beta-L-altropyranose hydrolase [Shewanella sairae]MCL1129277.1 UDP-2,4-diacetamido-2,4,6-trideoxy-beta-L-altropyranose hydrolase [Shewanella sairae]GIU51252.1 UDP-2,4-diacetamido-2,4,6-trideoxy-beta-L-altropyranose hydrolase [Shewanella sairae]